MKSFLLLQVTELFDWFLTLKIDFENHTLVIFVYSCANEHKSNQRIIDYCAGAIISHNLYTFYPILEDHFFAFNEVFSENSVFMYGYYSSAVSNQERVIMAHKRYINFFRKKSVFCWLCNTVLQNWGYASPPNERLKIANRDL